MSTNTQEENKLKSNNLIDFFRHFEVKIATSEKEINDVLKLRHDVFCEELGYEDVKDSGVETDDYDKFSKHCFVRHKKTGVLAGSLRVILPEKNEGKMAIEKFSQLMTDDAPNPKSFKRQEIGEVSRAVVPEKFRKRMRDDEKATDGNNNRFSKEEESCFSLIAIAMYLSAMSILQDGGRNNAFLLMEPRLSRSIRMIGIHAEQIGEKFEFRGIRAPYYIDVHKLNSTLKPEFLKFFNVIDHGLRMDKMDISDHQKSMMI